ALQKARALFATNPGQARIDVARLAVGCCWLLGRFERLSGVLERDGTLLYSDRCELVMYMGGEPYLDRLVYSEGAYLTWTACAMANPKASEDEITKLGSPEIKPPGLRDRESHTWARPAPIHRQQLKEMIDREIAWLTQREVQLRLAYEEPEREAAEK